MDDEDYDLCRCAHNRMRHDRADDSAGCFADLPRNDRGELEMCPCAAFEFDAWAEITAWARAGIEDRSMMSDEEIADLTTRAEEQIRADERARIAALLREGYDEDNDRVTFGEFASCSDTCPGIVMDHVLKLLDTPG